MRTKESIYKAMVKESRDNANRLFWDKKPLRTCISTTHRGICYKDNLPIPYELGELYGESQEWTKLDNIIKNMEECNTHTARIDVDILQELTKRRRKANGFVEITSLDGEITVYANADYVRDFVDLFGTNVVGLISDHEPLIFKTSKGTGFIFPVRVPKDKNASASTITDITLCVKADKKAIESVETVETVETVQAIQEVETVEEVEKVETIESVESVESVEMSDDDKKLIEYIALMDKLKAISDIKVEKIGTWLWIGGDTKPHKEELKELGFRWSRKRSKWYKAEDNNYNYKGRYKSQYSDFDAMRKAYA